MIDGTILNLIPTLITATITYVVAHKRARVQNAKILSNMQIQAIEQIRISENKMRDEIWRELDKVRKENAELREEMRVQSLQIMDLKIQLEAATQLRVTLTEQVHSLDNLVETYKTRIMELEKKS